MCFCPNEIYTYLFMFLFLVMRRCMSPDLNLIKIKFFHFMCSSSVKKGNREILSGNFIFVFKKARWSFEIRFTMSHSTYFYSDSKSSHGLKIVQSKNRGTSNRHLEAQRWTYHQAQFTERVAAWINRGLGATSLFLLMPFQTLDCKQLMKRKCMENVWVILFREMCYYLDLSS